jgi:hypothetical protein
MKVTWKPDGEPEQVWQFDPDDLMESEAELIQKRYGGRYSDFAAGVRGGDSKARRILLWRHLCQTHPTMRLEDVPDYRRKQLVVEYDVDELLLIRDRILKSDLAAEDKDEHLAAVEHELSERMAEVPDPVEVEPGKASSASA